MNTLIKKEIRLLLPTWITAFLLALFSPWISLLLAVFIYRGPDDWTAQHGLTFWVSLAALGCLFLGIASFGQEFSSGTFSALLSQPMERRRLWQIKTTTLATAIMSVWAAALLSGYLFFVLWTWNGAGYPWAHRHFRWDFFAGFHSDAFEFLTLSILVTFTGGLWSTLLLRQTTGAFWFTLLTPLALCFGIVSILTYGVANVNDSVLNKVLVVALLLYSVAGFFLARRLFFRAQDTQWTGGEISLSWPGKFFKSATVSVLPRHWLPALAWKEIHLQQANLLIAAIFVALNLLAMLVRKIHPHFENPDVQIIFEDHWVLWWFMPLLIGTTAIAEERRMGILESQLCLSVSRRVQLLVKFSVALILSLLLGGAMPVLLEGAKAELEPFYAVFIAAAVIFIPSFYSSSTVRTTLQALGVAILLGLAIILFGVLMDFSIERIGYDSSHIQSGLELLGLYLGPAILALVLGWLTLGNFERLHESRKLRRRNIAFIVAAFTLIFILINGVYFRGWELLMPAPSRGPARLDSSSRVTLAQNYNTLYATLPDGRLWAETFAFQNISNCLGESTVIVPGRCRTQFVPGSNWVQVAADGYQALGIQSDGTLWSLQRNWNLSLPNWFQTGSFKITRLGPDTDWSQVAGGRFGFFILKKDGSLWAWGNHEFNFNSHNRRDMVSQKLKEDLAALPVRVGGQAKYTQLYSSTPSPCATKSDGSCWTLNEGINSIPITSLETNFNNQWASWTGDASYVGVKTNGELWFYITVYQASEGKHGSVQEQIPLGRDAKWKTATFYGDAILALRDDDTLWSWSPRWDLANNYNSIKPVQLGTYSDWIALTGNWMAGLALAPDGNLYAWDQPSRHAWLAPSRRPVYVGNIFEGSP